MKDTCFHFGSIINVGGAPPQHLTESQDWTDPKVWKKANPSLGLTVGLDKVQAACDSARQNPGEENSFRQLRLNQWVKQSIRWMPMEKWDACAFNVNEESLAGRIRYGGLDLSSTTDMTAFVLVFPPLDGDDKYAILPYFGVPEDSLDLRVRRDHVPYDLWHRQGYLKTTEGNVVHYGFIVENDMFAEHSWYFRNALVRANYNDLKNGIYETTEFLELFLRNLLLGENHELKNRDLHISVIS